MNRRSFITKALVGIAAIPVLGKLLRSDARGVDFPKGDRDWPTRYHGFDVCDAAHVELPEAYPLYLALYGPNGEINGEGYRRAARSEDGSFVFVPRGNDWGPVTHFGIPDVFPGMRVPLQMTVLVREVETLTVLTTESNGLFS
jgi:hypothetical protein